MRSFGFGKKIGKHSDRWAGMHSLCCYALPSPDSFYQLKLAAVEEEGIELEVESSTAG